MKISKLKLKNFRNYDNLDINFFSNLNIIIGNNAQGKTSILEAIYFLAITKSNLLINDKNCIKYNKLFFRVEGDINSIVGNKKLTIVISNNNKKLIVNDNEIKKHSDYIGNLKIVIFNPDDVRLIKETPGNRRKFLNIEISQLYNKYINVLNQYNVILKQRNEYLKNIKNGKFNKLYFSVINEKLVDLAVVIYIYRLTFIDNINKYIGNVFKKIAGYDDLILSYLPNIDISDNNKIKSILLDKLENNISKEIIYGSTLYGFISQYRPKYYLTKIDTQYLFIVMLESMMVYN